MIPGCAISPGRHSASMTARLIAQRWLEGAGRATARRRTRGPHRQPPASTRPAPTPPFRRPRPRGGGRRGRCAGRTPRSCGTGSSAGSAPTRLATVRLANWSRPPPARASATRTRDRSTASCHRVRNCSGVSPAAVCHSQSGVAFQSTVSNGASRSRACREWENHAPPRRPCASAARPASSMRRR